MEVILKLVRVTNLQAYAQDDDESVPESIHLARPARSTHCCCTSHHQFCLEGPESIILYRLSHKKRPLKFKVFSRKSMSQNTKKND